MVEQRTTFFVLEEPYYERRMNRKGYVFPVSQLLLIGGFLTTLAEVANNSPQNKEAVRLNIPTISRTPRLLSLYPLGKNEYMVSAVHVTPSKSSYLGVESESGWGLEEFDLLCFHVMEAKIGAGVKLLVQPGERTRTTPETERKLSSPLLGAVIV